MEKTYTLARRPHFSNELCIDVDAKPLPDTELMTLLEARKALDIARKQGHDVIMLNTKPAMHTNRKKRGK